MRGWGQRLIFRVGAFLGVCASAAAQVGDDSRGEIDPFLKSTYVRHEATQTILKTLTPRPGQALLGGRGSLLHTPLCQRLRCLFLGEPRGLGHDGGTDFLTLGVQVGNHLRVYEWHVEQQDSALPVARYWLMFKSESKAAVQAMLPALMKAFTGRPDSFGLDKCAAQPRQIFTLPQGRAVNCLGGPVYMVRIHASADDLWVAPDAPLGGSS